MKLVTELMGHPVYRDVISLIINNVIPDDRREPVADTKCPPAAQRKQAKRACILVSRKLFIICAAVIWCICSMTYMVNYVASSHSAKTQPRKGCQ